MYKLVFRVARNKDVNITKYRDYYKLMCRWVNTPIENVEGYLRRNNVTKVAIYGARDMGEVLFNQLVHTSISVEYFIDKSSFSNSFSNLPVYLPDDKMSSVDMVIVTPYMDYESIKGQINSKNSFNVVSIKELINGANKL